MNISEYYYKNQANKIEKLNKRMLKEIDKLKKEVFTFEENDNYFLKLVEKNLEYKRRYKIILERYKKLIIKEQNKSLKATGKLFSFDSIMKKQKEHNDE